ncbi:hypothetical protein [Streptomyces sp. SID3343]|uniref:hypothetical protein n=1 Tax=Streptomyces sp. SID3343 TaxID=2690260 RepID=UPI00136F3ABA|nr:hypothetical protein [Streptomyces sp. SID3343]MYW04673.1 hypothetical protein [Streptomyces sp. SID3343]
MMSAMPATDEPEAVVSHLWQESRSQPWPSRLNSAEPAGVDLAALDVRLSGCIHTWLYHRGSFGARHLHTVRVLLRELEQVLPELTEEDSPHIWQRYHQMAQLISDNNPHSTN